MVNNESVPAVRFCILWGIKRCDAVRIAVLRFGATRCGYLLGGAGVVFENPTVWCDLIHTERKTLPLKTSVFIVAISISLRIPVLTIRTIRKLINNHRLCFDPTSGVIFQSTTADAHQ